MVTPEVLRSLKDPLRFARLFWPDVTFYRQQMDIIYSVRDNDETFVPAGNMLGKDFVGGFICLWFFLTRHPVRVVTTSVKDDHLRVLWGEIGRFIQTCRAPLLYKDGGPLIARHRDIRKIVRGEVCQISYLLGMVSEKGEGMAGHHAKHTLGVIDEACHDAETEVLSEEGWKRFADLTSSDRLLTMDPATRIAEYQHPVEIHRHQYSGPMYLYERRCGNFCVTPSHRMLWSRQRASCAIPWSDYYLEPIKSINGTDRAIPRCFRWTGLDIEHFEIPGLRTKRKTYPPRQVSMADWLEFLGWYIAEGSLAFGRNGEPKKVAVSQKDMSVLHRLAEIARRMGFSPRVYPGPSASLRIGERRLADYLLGYGRYSYEKRIPSFVGSLSPKLIEIFLQAFKQGDGYDRAESGREILYTSSQRLADDLQILSFKAGRESTVCQRKLIGLPAPNGTSRRDGFVVSRSRDGLDSHLKIKRQHLQIVDYTGEVACAQMSTHHTLFTRRRGVCMWSGNSGVDDLVYNQMDTWAKRKLIIGNPNPCANFFKAGVKGGDIVAQT